MFWIKNEFSFQTCHCVWGEVLPEGGRGIVLYESILGRGIARQNRNMVILFLKIWNDLRYNFTV